MAFVYELVCPVENVRRYVGVTTQDPKRRLVSHWQSPARGLRPWIKRLKELGKKPGLLVVAELPPGEALKLEYELIVKSTGLLNRTHRQGPTVAQLFPSLEEKVAQRPAGRVIPGYDWLKWWKTKVNDQFGPFWTARDFGVTTTPLSCVRRRRSSVTQRPAGRVIA